MDKAFAIKKAGGTQQKLADLLGVTRQLVSSWPEEIPRKWELEMRDKFPRWAAEWKRHGQR